MSEVDRASGLKGSAIEHVTAQSKMRFGQRDERGDTERISVGKIASGKCAGENARTAHDADRDRTLDWNRLRARRGGAENRGADETT